MAEDNKEKNFGEGDSNRVNKSKISKEITSRIPKKRTSKKIPTTKSEKIEREYTIPLREKVRVVPRYKKTNKAVKTVKEFLARHMKIYDRDLNKIKLDKYLNEALWSRGIRKPPHKIKVKAIKEGDIVRVELVDYSDNLKFKKAREEKALQKAKELLAGKKSKMAKMKKGMPGEAEEGAAPEGEVKQTEEKKVEEKEKKAAVVEAGAKREKAAAQTEKKSAKAAGKMTQQKHQVRKALAK